MVIHLKLSDKLKDISKKALHLNDFSNYSDAKLFQFSETKNSVY